MRDFAYFFTGLVIGAIASITVRAEYHPLTQMDTAAAAPEAALIPDPWPSEPPEPAPPDELGEGLFRWVPGHWEEIKRQTLFPAKPLDLPKPDERRPDPIVQKPLPGEAERHKALSEIIEADALTPVERTELLRELLNGHASPETVLERMKGLQSLRLRRDHDGDESIEPKPDPTA